MRSRLRLFAIVGLIATAVDLGVFLAALHYDASVWAADVVALVLAAIVAYTGNRTVTFRGDREARWVSQPDLFAATALGAGLVDLAVVLALMQALSVPAALAKAVAIAGAACVRWIAYRQILLGRVRRELNLRGDRPPVQAGHRLSLVLPAYNEEDRIAATIAALTDVLHPALGADEVELLVVDDGSADATAERAAEAGASVVRLDPNQGKGAAVRAGMAAADGRTVIFTDADLAYGPELLLNVLEGVEAGWDVVVGSRRHQASEAAVRARTVRRIGGWFVNRLTYLVLLGQFRDTQCGLKGFRGDLAPVIFERTRIDGFAFDVEIFLMAEQDHLSLLELPVTVSNRPGSSVSLVGDSIGLLGDLFRIRRWAGKGFYQPTPEQAAVLAGRVEGRRPGHDSEPVIEVDEPEVDSEGVGGPHGAG